MCNKPNRYSNCTLDRSGSLGRTTNNVAWYEYEKQAAISFIDKILSQPLAVRQNIRIGAVDWAGNNNLVRTFAITSDLNAVKSIHFSFTRYTGDTDKFTCIECGLKCISIQRSN